MIILGAKSVYLEKHRPIHRRIEGIESSIQEVIF